MSRNFFTLKSADPSGARAGMLHTQHGDVRTPVFMPVGTLGAVKTLAPVDLKEAGVKMILANAYHLYLRPGTSILSDAGGIHEFNGWDGPILTDSGGYQVFSLAHMREISDEGVKFRNHIDGLEHLFTPKMVIELERAIGADITMAFDECVPYPCRREEAEHAVRRTADWAHTCREAFENTKPLYGYDQVLFGIVQGGVYRDLREKSASAISSIGFDGIAIGGLSVGEPSPMMYEVCEFTAELLPREKPRYLMGVGRPQDVVECVGSGIDMFDCVVPTRNARKGTVYTYSGKMNLKNTQYRSDFRPIDEGCACSTCSLFSRSYLRHLFKIGEMLAGRAATIHNLYFYSSLMERIRAVITGGKFAEFREEFYRSYKSEEERVEVS